jgi:hypothetical protein
MCVDESLDRIVPFRIARVAECDTINFSSTNLLSPTLISNAPYALMKHFRCPLNENSKS